MNRRIKLTPQQKLYVVLQGVQTNHDKDGSYVFDKDLFFKLPSAKSCEDGYEYLYSNLRIAESYLKAFEALYKKDVASNELVELGLCKNYSTARNIRMTILNTIKNDKKLYKNYIKTVHDSDAIDYSQFSDEVSYVLQTAGFNSIAEIKSVTINDIAILKLRDTTKVKILNEIYEYLLSIDKK